MTASNVVQITLEGDETDNERERPETFLWCPETDQWVLRSLRFDWPYELYESPEAHIEELNDTSEPDDSGVGDDSDEPERVGAWYDVTISVSVDYRFRIPAWSDHEAKDLAKEWRLDARPADSHVVHTQTREVDEITTEDVPEDFDPYGSELLYEVFEDAK
ncbi:hypothetical protein OB905_13270 [Halobacteria archaeon AArc-dxtr1]|nr:hypothetical protein [Halobacteria archaeon AArc-dxtr1]